MRAMTLRTHLVHFLLQLQSLCHGVFRGVPVPSGRCGDVHQHDVAAPFILITQKFHGMLALFVRCFLEILVQAWQRDVASIEVVRL